MAALFISAGVASATGPDLNPAQLQYDVVTPLELQPSQHKAAMRPASAFMLGLLF